MSEAYKSRQPQFNQANICENYQYPKGHSCKNKEPDANCIHWECIKLVSVQTIPGSLTQKTHATAEKAVHSTAQRKHRPL